MHLIAELEGKQVHSPSLYVTSTWLDLAPEDPFRRVRDLSATRREPVGSRLY